MGKKIVVAALGALMCATMPSSPAYAQAVHSPAVGSQERAAILDALRPSIEAELGSNIEFVVEQISVKNGVALVHAHPQRRGGRQIDARRFYQRYDDMGGIGVTGILRLSRGRWNLIERSIGATDVWWCHLVPRGLSDGCR